MVKLIKKEELEAMSPQQLAQIYEEVKADIQLVDSQIKQSQINLEVSQKERDTLKIQIKEEFGVESVSELEELKQKTLLEYEKTIAELEAIQQGVS